MAGPPRESFAECKARATVSALPVERRRYQERPPRDEYHLTASGRDLFPVLRELVRWGNRHIPGTNRPPPGALDEPPG